MPKPDAGRPGPAPNPPKLMRRLQYSQALHQCAQALLQPITDHSDYRRALTEALEHLRVAAGTGRAALFRNFDDAALGFCFDMVAESCAPGVPSSMEGGYAARVAWSRVPARHQDSQAAGLPVGGPTVEVFAEAPAMRDALLLDGILSVHFFPVFLGTEWWGFIGFDDYTSARVWDEEELLLQRTAVAMIGGALLRWRADEKLQAAHEAAVIHQERLRVARELHDALTQSVYSITLFARGGTDALQRGDTDTTRQVLQAVEETAHHALVEMRLLLFELQVGGIEQGSLQDALEARFNLVERRLGVHVTFSSTLASEPSSPVRELLLHVALEALNNALKHAAAKHVTVQLWSDTTTIRMAIGDDGCGFDLQQTPPGMGLHTMRDRAAFVGGRVEIKSTPGGGTEVLCWLPRMPAGTEAAAFMDG